MTTSQCPHCRAQEQGGDFCTSCLRILPGEHDDLFAVLGLERRWRLAPDDIADAFHSRSRKFHPDRFHNASALERRLAMSRTQDVNKAYDRLRAPMARARYLVELASRNGLGVSEPVAPPELLMETVEARELAQDLAQSGQGSVEQIQHLLGKYRTRMHSVVSAVEEQFDRADAGVALANVVVDLLPLLVEHKYVSGIVEELLAALERVTAKQSRSGK